MNQCLFKLFRRYILLLLTVVFGYNDFYAQHLFSVDYGDMRVDADSIKTQATKSNTSLSTILMTKNRNNQDVYSFSLSAVQNTKIVILNEETGRNVVITPQDGAPALFELPPFFIEELRRAVLGNAKQYLVAETDDYFLVRKAATVSAVSQDVYIPRYFYGTKENVKEALPKDRKIIHIFKEKPILIPAFPNDPNNMRHVANLEEEMSYYVYMYQLPDGTLTIYDEHFSPNMENNEVNTINTFPNLQFSLSGNTTGQMQTATLHALNLWSEQLFGTVPVDINVTVKQMLPGTLGGSYRTPNYLIDSTFYPSPLANQMLGNDFSPLRDIRIEINSMYLNDFYFELDGNTPNGHYDWVELMLHEVCHGLGFFPLVGSDGAYTYTTSNGGSSSTEYPGIYDRQLYQDSTGNTCLTDLPQIARRTVVTSVDYLYAGAPDSHLLRANGGARVKIYAPNPWESGSSVSHWDMSVTYFPTFMRPVYNNPPLHTFNTRKIGIMRDMGWETCDIILNDTTFNSGIRSIAGCSVEISNTTIEPNTTVVIHGQDFVLIKSNFHAKEESDVTITSGD